MRMKEEEVCFDGDWKFHHEDEELNYFPCIAFSRQNFILKFHSCGILAFIFRNIIFFSLLRIHLNNLRYALKSFVMNAEAWEETFLCNFKNRFLLNLSEDIPHCIMFAAIFISLSLSLTSMFDEHKNNFINIIDIYITISWQVLNFYFYLQITTLPALTNKSNHTTIGSRHTWENFFYLNRQGRRQSAKIKLYW